MSYALVWIVLSGTTVAANESSSLWMTDYCQAYSKARKAKKPLAVVFGPGEQGWNRVVRDGAMNGTTNRLLKESFVALHVDTATKKGKKLAKDFNLRGQVGIVISDRAVDRQRLKHAGTMSQTQLARELRRGASSPRSEKRRYVPVSYCPT